MYREPDTFVRPAYRSRQRGYLRFLREPTPRSLSFTLYCKVAAALLAWWNAEECGGFDLTDVWGVDTPIAVDMLRVFALLAGCHQCPDNMGYGKHFEAIVRAWRSAAEASERRETL